MDLNEDVPVANQIQAYSDRSITVNGIEYTTSIWIDQNKVTPISYLKLDDIKPLEIKNEFLPGTECVLIGSGQQASSHPIGLIWSFAQIKLGCEVMTTPAACRTFNIMSADLRKVVAILLLP